MNEGIKEDPYLKIVHRINLHVDVVAGDDSLPANGADLYFHIHNTERRVADVDVGKTRVDSLVEVSKYVKKVGHVTPPP